MLVDDGGIVGGGAGRCGGTRAISVSAIVSAVVSADVSAVGWGFGRVGRAGRACGAVVR
ncbi:MAG: hypothetical protein F2836_03200 [Actinobacteria bacterium]|nr:hypothetical protein [Actinomycetota bacterium]